MGGYKATQLHESFENRVQKQQIYKKHGTVLQTNGDNVLSHSYKGTGG